MRGTLSSSWNTMNGSSMEISRSRTVLVYRWWLNAWDSVQFLEHNERLKQGNLLVQNYICVQVMTQCVGHSPVPGTQ
jgi:hypothetical protein